MKIALVIVAIIIAAVGIFAYTQFGAYEKTFTTEPVMDPNVEGHFQSHPDNSAPDIREIETIDQ